MLSTTKLHRARAAPNDDIRVPREFVELARKVILHRSPDRFAALYRVLLRLKAEPQLMQIDVDPDVMRLRVLERQVRHDEHRMHAYVRFRKVDDQSGAQFVAWYEPEHHIVEATAEFFARRFAGQRWAILTPDRSVYWDGNQLTYGDGVARADAPADDALEDLWRTYYASTFNPARVNVKVTQGHMPKKFWANLPEAQLIAPLASAAPTRAGQMIAAEAAAPRRSRVPPVALTCFFAQRRFRCRRAAAQVARSNAATARCGSTRPRQCPARDRCQRA